MSSSPRLAGVFLLCVGTLTADSPLAPALQWVQTLGGSGTSQVTGAAADSHGNLYLTGSTSSIDLPVTAAVQPNAGASPLYRIDTSTGVARKLYPPGLSAATSIAVDSKNPPTIYATEANSIWRSSDVGGTWSTLLVFPAAVAVHFVAVDPSNSNVLYAATSPQGVFKSSDGGQTWTAVNNGILPSRGGGIDAFRVWTDPKIPQVVFVATDTGLLRSADGAATWSMVVTTNYVASTFTFDPFSPGTVYLAIGLQITKSTDDGQTFTPISALPDQSFAQAMVADPFRQGVLYVCADDGIYQSTGGGWTRKMAVGCSVIAADPANPVLYANVSANGLASSTDGFTTSTIIGPPETSLLQAVVTGPSVWVVAQSSTDAFVTKLDSNGNVVYSTYFGGSAADSATAIAIGADGSAYVTGNTSSIDFPTTPGAYEVPPKFGSAFVFKLNPDGSLAWSTYFADGGSPVAAIAVDAAGDAYIAGSSRGGVPTTAGAYQTQFQQSCTPTFLIGCIPGPTSAFVTKFNPNGSALIFSTYVPMDSRKVTVPGASALLPDASGNVYFAGGGEVILLNAAGSALLASSPPASVSLGALARDANGNIYAAGTSSNPSFPATAGAFQTAPRPAIPSLPGQLGAGGGGEAFVMKWDSGLTQLQAATLLGGELSDTAESIAVDSSGNVIVSGSTDSKGFPTRAPFQGTFSAHSGFVAAFDPTLSNLLFSTYLGDARAFDARIAVPDGNGNILLAGSTLTTGGLFIGGDPGLSFTTGNLVVANKIALSAAGAVRLDSVQNAASHLSPALSAGETFAAVGAGFGADAQLLIDGSPLPLLEQTSTSLTAAIPANAKTSGAFAVQVSSGGAVSNVVLMPAAAASPGLFTVDGSGYNQGYILNSDGTQNSASNPAAPGSAITIFVTGAGPYTLSGPYAVTALFPYVYVDGFFANGIAATVGPVAGLPGNVYQLGAYVPDPATLVASNPNLKDFKMPPQVAVKVVFGAVNPSNPDNSAIISQPGVVLNVKP